MSLNDQVFNLLLADCSQNCVFRFWTWLMLFSKWMYYANNKMTLLKVTCCFDLGGFYLVFIFKDLLACCSNFINNKGVQTWFQNYWKSSWPFCSMHLQLRCQTSTFRFMDLKLVVKGYLVGIQYEVFWLYLNIYTHILVVSQLCV